MSRPRCSGIPKQERRAEIKQGEHEADHKRREEKVPEKNNFIAFHGVDYLLQRGQINHKPVAHVALHHSIVRLIDLLNGNDFDV